MTCSIPTSYAPATLKALGALWKAHGGTNLGIVGGRTHKAGYHLGRNRIYAVGPTYFAGVIVHRRADGTKYEECVKGLGAADYSIGQFERDGAHATNAAMAIDLGPLSGVKGTEVAAAKWLIGQCQRSASDTLDIRAVNYTTQRYDKYNGVTSAVYSHDVNETGHIHVEHFRDSEARDKTAWLKRYFATLRRTVKCSGGKAWSAPKSSSTAVVDLPAGTVLQVLGTVSGGAWSFSCNGVARSGTSWAVVNMVNGKLAKTLYGVRLLYVATGRL